MPIPQNSYDYLGLQLSGLNDNSIAKDVGGKGFNIFYPDFDTAEQLYGEKLKGEGMSDQDFKEMYNMGQMGFAQYEQNVFKHQGEDRNRYGWTSDLNALEGINRNHPWQGNIDPEANPMISPDGRRIMTDQEYASTLGWVATEDGKKVVSGNEVFPNYGVFNSEGVMKDKLLTMVYPENEGYNPKLGQAPGNPYLKITKRNEVLKNTEIFSTMGPKGAHSDGWLRSLWDGTIGMLYKSIPSAVGTTMEAATPMIESIHAGQKIDDLFNNSPGTWKGVANELQNTSSLWKNPGNFQQDEGFGQNLSATSFAIGSGIGSLFQQFASSRLLGLTGMNPKLRGNMASLLFSAQAGDAIYQEGKESGVPEDQLAELFFLSAFTTHLVERGIRMNNNWITDGGAIMAVNRDIRATIKKEISEALKIYGKKSWTELSKAEQQQASKSIMRKIGDFTGKYWKGANEYMQKGTRLSNTVAAFAEEGTEELIEQVLNNSYETFTDYSNKLANPDWSPGSGLFGAIDPNKGAFENLVAYNTTDDNRRLTEGTWESFIVGGISGGFMGSFRGPVTHREHLMQAYVVQGKQKEFFDVLEQMRKKGELGPKNVDIEGKPMNADNPEGVSANEFVYNQMKGEFEAYNNVWNDSGIAQWYKAWTAKDKLKKSFLGIKYGRDKIKEATLHAMFVDKLKNGGFDAKLVAADNTVLMTALRAMKEVTELEASKQEDGANIEAIDKEIATKQQFIESVKSGDEFKNIYKRAYLFQRLNYDPFFQLPYADLATIAANGTPERVVDQINQSVEKYVQYMQQQAQQWEQQRQEKLQSDQDYLTTLGALDLPGLSIEKLSGIINATSEYGGDTETIKNIAKGLTARIEQAIADLNKDFTDNELIPEGLELEHPVAEGFNPDALNLLNDIVGNEDLAEDEKIVSKEMLDNINKIQSLEDGRNSLWESSEKEQPKNPFDQDPQKIKFDGYLSQLQEDEEGKVTNVQNILEVLDYFKDKQITDIETINQISNLLMQLQYVRSSARANVMVYNYMEDEISGLTDNNRLSDQEWNQLDAMIQSALDLGESIKGKFATREMIEHNYKEQFIKVNKKYLKDIFSRLDAMGLMTDEDKRVFTSVFEDAVIKYNDAREPLGENLNQEQLVRLSELQNEVINGLEAAMTTIGNALRKNPDKAQEIFNQLFGYWDGDKFKPGIYSYATDKKRDHWQTSSWYMTSLGTIVNDDNGAASYVNFPFMNSNNLITQVTQATEEEKFENGNMKKFHINLHAFSNLFNLLKRTDRVQLNEAIAAHFNSFAADELAPSFEQKVVIEQAVSFLMDQSRAYVPKSKEQKLFDNFLVIQGAAGTGKSTTVLRSIISVASKLKNLDKKTIVISVPSAHQSTDMRRRVAEKFPNLNVQVIEEGELVNGEIGDNVAFVVADEATFLSLDDLKKIKKSNPDTPILLMGDVSQMSGDGSSVAPVNQHISEVTNPLTEVFRTNVYHINKVQSAFRSVSNISTEYVAPVLPFGEVTADNNIGVKYIEDKDGSAQIMEVIDAAKIDDNNVTIIVGSEESRNTLIAEINNIDANINAKKIVKTIIKGDNSAQGLEFDKVFVRISTTDIPYQWNKAMLTATSRAKSYLNILVPDDIRLLMTSVPTSKVVEQITGRGDEIVADEANQLQQYKQRAAANSAGLLEYLKNLGFNVTVPTETVDDGPQGNEDPTEGSNQEKVYSALMRVKEKEGDIKRDNDDQPYAVKINAEGDLFFPTRSSNAISSVMPTRPASVKDSTASRTVGNIIHKLIENYVNGTASERTQILKNLKEQITRVNDNQKHPINLNKSLYTGIIDAVKAQTEMIDAGLKAGSMFITELPIVNMQFGLGGTLDLVEVNRFGNVSIIDIKTARPGAFEARKYKSPIFSGVGQKWMKKPKGYEESTGLVLPNLVNSKKNNVGLQQFIYRKMMESGEPLIGLQPNVVRSIWINFSNINARTGEYTGSGKFSFAPDYKYSESELDALEAWTDAIIWNNINTTNIPVTEGPPARVDVKDTETEIVVDDDTTPDGPIIRGYLPMPEVTGEEIIDNQQQTDPTGTKDIINFDSIDNHKNGNLTAMSRSSVTGGSNNLNENPHRAFKFFALETLVYSALRNGRNPSSHTTKLVYYKKKELFSDAQGMMVEYDNVLAVELNPGDPGVQQMVNFFQQKTGITPTAEMMLLGTVPNIDRHTYEGNPNTVPASVVLDAYNADKLEYRKIGWDGAGVDGKYDFGPIQITNVTPGRISFTNSANAITVADLKSKFEGQGVKFGNIVVLYNPPGKEGIRESGYYLPVTYDAGSVSGRAPVKPKTTLIKLKTKKIDALAYGNELAEQIVNDPLYTNDYTWWSDILDYWNANPYTFIDFSDPLAPQLRGKLGNFNYGEGPILSVKEDASSTRNKKRVRLHVKLPNNLTSSEAGKFVQALFKEVGRMVQEENLTPMGERIDVKFVENARAGDNRSGLEAIDQVSASNNMTINVDQIFDPQIVFKMPSKVRKKGGNPNPNGSNDGPNNMDNFKPKFNIKRITNETRITSQDAEAIIRRILGDEYYDTLVQEVGNITTEEGMQAFGRVQNALMTLENMGGIESTTSRHEAVHILTTHVLSPYQRKRLLVDIKRKMAKSRNIPVNTITDIMAEEWLADYYGKAYDTTTLKGALRSFVDWLLRATGLNNYFYGTINQFMSDAESGQYSDQVMEGIVSYKGPSYSMYNKKGETVQRPDYLVKIFKLPTLVAQIHRDVIEKDLISESILSPTVTGSNAEIKDAVNIISLKYKSLANQYLAEEQTYNMNGVEVPLKGLNPDQALSLLQDGNIETWKKWVVLQLTKKGPKDSLPIIDKFVRLTFPDFKRDRKDSKTILNFEGKEMSDEDITNFEYLEEHGESSIQMENDRKNPLDSLTDMTRLWLNNIDYYIYETLGDGQRVARPANPSDEHQYIKQDNLWATLIQLQQKAKSGDERYRGLPTMEAFRLVLLDAANNSGETYMKNMLFSVYDRVFFMPGDESMGGDVNPLSSSADGLLMYSLMDMAKNPQRIAAENPVNKNAVGNPIKIKALNQADLLHAMESLFRSITQKDYFKSFYDYRLKRTTSVPIRTSFADKILKGFKQKILGKLYTFVEGMPVMTKDSREMFSSQVQVRMLIDGKPANSNSWVFEDELPRLLSAKSVVLDKDGKTPKFYHKAKVQPTFSKKNVKGGTEISLKGMGKIFMVTKNNISWHPDITNIKVVANIILRKVGLTGSDIRSGTINAYLESQPIENLNSRSGQSKLSNVSPEGLSNGLGSIVMDLMDPAGAATDDLARMLGSEDEVFLEETEAIPTALANFQFLQELASVESFSRGDNQNSIYYNVNNDQVYRLVFGGRINDLFGFDGTTADAQDGAIKLFQSNLISLLVSNGVQVNPNANIYDLLNMALESNIQIPVMQETPSGPAILNPFLDPDSLYKIKGIISYDGVTTRYFGKRYGKMTPAEFLDNMINSEFVDKILKNTNRNAYTMPGYTPGDKKSPEFFQIEHDKEAPLVIVKGDAENQSVELNTNFVAAKMVSLFQKKRNQATKTVRKVHSVLREVMTTGVLRYSVNDLGEMPSLQDSISDPRILEEWISGLSENMVNQEDLDKLVDIFRASELIINKDYKVYPDGSLHLGNDSMTQNKKMWVKGQVVEAHDQFYTIQNYDDLMGLSSPAEQWAFIQNKNRGMLLRFIKYLSTANGVGFQRSQAFEDTTPEYDGMYYRTVPTEDGTETQFNPWIESYYYGWMILNNNLEDIIGGSSGDFKSITDLFKRISSEKSPGVVATIGRRGMPVKSEVVILDDNPLRNDLLMLLNDSNPTLNAAEDSLTMQLPLYTLAAHQGLGGRFGMMQNPYGPNKPVHKELDIATNEGLFFKTAGIPLTTELMNRSRKIRAIVEKSLSHKPFMEVDSIDPTTLWDKYLEFEELSINQGGNPWDLLREYVISQDTPQFVQWNKGTSIHKTYVAYFIYNSGVKQGSKMVNNLEYGLTSDEGFQTISVDNRGTRWQLNPHKEIERDDSAMFKQLAAEVMVGASTQEQSERINRLVTSQAELNKLNRQEISQKIDEMGVSDFLRNEAEKSAASQNTELAQFLRLIADDNISIQIPVIATRIKNVLRKLFNKGIKPRMKGYSAVQMPGTMMEIFETNNGEIFTLKQVENILGRKLEINEDMAAVASELGVESINARNLNHLKIIIGKRDVSNPDLISWSDPEKIVLEAMDQLGVSVEQSRQNYLAAIRAAMEAEDHIVKIIPPEAITPFDANDAQAFGFNIEDSTAYTYYKNWDVADIMTINFSDGTAARYESMGNDPEQIESVIADMASNGNPIKIDDTLAWKVLVSRTPQLAEADYSVQLLSLMNFYKSFDNYLLTVMNRVPSSNTATGNQYRIISFVHDNGNVVWQSPNKNILDDSDYDVDEQRVYTSQIGVESGFDNEEGLKEMIFNSVRSFYQDPNNIQFFYSPVSVEQDRKSVEGANESHKIKEILRDLGHEPGSGLKLNDVTSSVMAYEDIMEGKYTVGPFIMTIKAYTHLYNAYKSVEGSHFRLNFMGEVYSSFSNGPAGNGRSADGAYVIDLLAELSQLALDNANELVLGKILANPNTAYFIAGLDIAGVPREKIIQFLLNSTVSGMLQEQKRSTSVHRTTVDLLENIDVRSADIEAGKVMEILQKQFNDDWSYSGLRKFAQLLDRFAILNTDSEERKQRYIGDRGTDPNEVSNDQKTQMIVSTMPAVRRNYEGRNVVEVLMHQEDFSFDGLSTSQQTNAIQFAIDNLIITEISDPEAIKTNTFALASIYSDSGLAGVAALSGLEGSEAAVILDQIQVAKTIAAVETIPALEMLEEIVKKSSVTGREPNWENIKNALENKLEVLASFKKIILFGEAIKRTALTSNIDQGISKGDYGSSMMLRNMEIWANQPFEFDDNGDLVVVSSTAVRDPEYYFMQKASSLDGTPRKTDNGADLLSLLDTFRENETIIRSYVDIGLVIENNPHLKDFIASLVQYNQINNSAFKVNQMKDIIMRTILEDINKDSLSERQFDNLMGNLSSYLIGKYFSGQAGKVNMSFEYDNKGDQIGEVLLNTPEGRHVFLDQFAERVAYIKNNLDKSEFKEFSGNHFFNKLQVRPSRSGGYHLTIDGLGRMDVRELAKLQYSLSKIPDTAFVQGLFNYSIIQSGFQMGPNNITSLFDEKLFYPLSNFLEGLHMDTEKFTYPEIENEFKTPFLVKNPNLLDRLKDDDPNYEFEAEEGALRREYTGITHSGRILITDAQNPNIPHAEYVTAYLKLPYMRRASLFVLKLNDEGVEYTIIKNKYSNKSIPFKDDAIVPVEDSEGTAVGTGITFNVPYDVMKNIQKGKPDRIVLAGGKVSYGKGWIDVWATGWNKIVQINTGTNPTNNILVRPHPDDLLSVYLGINSIQSRRLGARSLDLYINRLSKAFPGLKGVIKVVGGKEFQRMFSKNTLGSVSNGMIYFNRDKVALDTPAHELGHIWLRVIQRFQPDVYTQLLSKAYKSPLYGVIKSQPEYSNLSDVDIAEEVVVTSLGFRVSESNFGKLVSEINEDGTASMITEIKLWISDFWASVKNGLRRLFGFRANPFRGLDIENSSLYTITQSMADTMMKGAKVSNITPAEFFGIKDTRTRLSVTLGSATDITNDILGLSSEAQVSTDFQTVKDQMKKSMLMSQNISGEFAFETNGGKKYVLPTLTDEAAINNMVKKIIDERGDYEGKLRENIVAFIRTSNADSLPPSLQKHADQITKLIGARESEEVLLYQDLKSHEDPGVRALYNPAVVSPRFNPIMSVRKTNEGGVVVNMHDITPVSLRTVYGSKLDNFSTYQESSILDSSVVKLTNTEAGKRKFELLLGIAGMIQNNPNVRFRRLGIHQLTTNDVVSEGLHLGEYSKELKQIITNKEFKSKLSPEMLAILENDNILNLQNYKQAWLSQLTDFYQAEKDRMYKMAKAEPAAGKKGSRYSKMGFDLAEAVDINGMFGKDIERVVKSRMDQMMKQYGNQLEGPNGLLQDEEFRLLSRSLRMIKNRGRKSIASDSTVDVNWIKKQIGGNFNLANPIAQWFVREMKRAMDVIGNRFFREYKKPFAKLFSPVQKFYENSNPFSLVSERVRDTNWKIFDAMLIKQQAKDENGGEHLVDLYQIYHSGDPRTAAAVSSGKINSDHVALGDFIVKTIKDQIVKSRMRKGETREEAVAWYDGNWTDGMLPTMARRAAQKIFGGDLQGGMSDWLKAYTNSNELFENVIEKKSGYDLGDMFAWQAGSSTLGSEQRQKMLGLRTNESGELIMRENGLKDNRGIEKNLEVIMNYFVMNQIMKQEMDDIMPEYMASKTLLYNYDNSKGLKYKNTIDYIDKTTDFLIKQQRQGIGVSVPLPGNRSVAVDNIVNNANGLVSFGIMGGNIYADTVNFMANALQAASFAWGQTLNKGSEFFNWKNIAVAVKVATTNPELMWKLIRQYRFAQMDNQDLIHAKWLQKSQKHFALFQSNWLFSLNFAGDYINRAIVLMAQMDKDGVLSAYSVGKDGELIYDVKKDTRDAKVKKKIKDELVREGVQDEDEPLQRAYDSRLRTRVKTIADKYITGSYDQDVNRLLNSHVLGKMFSMFKKYAFDKIENTFQRGQWNEALGNYVITEIDDPFVPGDKKMEVIWQERFVEGTIMSIFAMLNEAKRITELSPGELHTIWTGQEPQRKENIIRLAHDLMLVTAIIKVLPFLVGGLDDEEDSTMEQFMDTRLWKSVEFGFMDLLYGTNPNEYFRALADPFVTIVQMERYFQFIQSWFSGESTKMHNAARKSFGAYRTISDVPEYVNMFKN
jgi:hypothetical protein